MKSLRILLAFVALLGFQFVRAQDARTYFKLGFEQYQSKNYQAAENLFSKGLALDDKDAKAWQYYGETLEANKALLRARRAYVHATTLMQDGLPKTTLENKVKSLKPSIFPGEICRDLVEKVSPDLLKKMAAEIADWPEIVGSRITYKTDKNPDYPVTTTSVPCGDIYLYKTTIVEGGAGQILSVLCLGTLKLLWQEFSRIHL